MKKLQKIDHVIFDMAVELEKLNDKYDLYNFVITDDIDEICVRNTNQKFNSSCLDYNDCLKDITSILSKIIKDKNLILKIKTDYTWTIESEKLNELIQKDREKIVLQSEQKFGFFDKYEISFIDELKLKDTITWNNDKKYKVYIAPTQELSKKVDSFLSFRGCHDIDELYDNKEINIKI